MLCDLLQTQGYHAVGVSDGTEALDLLHTLPNLSLVILDLRMPGMGGERFLEALRTHTDCQTVEAIVLTGDTDSAARLRHQGIEVLTKPTDLRVILATIRRLCGGDGASAPGAPP